MKKLSIVLSVILTLISVQIVRAEEVEIEGLHENWSRLFMANCFTEEELAEIDREYMEATEKYLIEEYIPLRKAYNRMETGSDEAELQLLLEEAKVDYSGTVRVSRLTTNRFAGQYAENNQFSLLFNGVEYWSAPNYRSSDRARFEINGNYIADVLEYFDDDYDGLILMLPTFEWLKDEMNIYNMVKECGITVVNDIKLFTATYTLTFMYVQGDNKEYIAVLYPEEGYFKPFDGIIERQKLYPVLDVINPIISQDKNSYVHAHRLAKNAALTKPTYETEATALQSEGLLYGNENGLDLLKPLTRIEAAAMLLRALGESETAAADSVQVFSDVPSTHWGYGAAANAYSLGLIYGVGDNLFAPDKRVTATEFASMILRAAGEQEFDWQQAINLLIERGIITQENADTMDFFTRGDMAKIIYEVRAKGLV